MYVGKERIHKYMQYEVSMPVYMGRIANQRKVPKWVPFKNYKSESLYMSRSHESGGDQSETEHLTGSCFKLL